jgi:hypothetical protein
MRATYILGILFATSLFAQAQDDADQKRKKNSANRSGHTPDAHH